MEGLDEPCRAKIAESIQKDPCVDRHSCHHSNNWLSQRITCAMASDREVGSGRFNNKSLTSFHSPHQNALISGLLFQSTSSTRSQNSVACVEAAHDFC